jgi:CrcB protein
MAIFERGQHGLALFYVLASVLLSLGAIILAMFITRGVFQ